MGRTWTWWERGLTELIEFICGGGSKMGGCGRSIMLCKYLLSSIDEARADEVFNPRKHEGKKDLKKKNETQPNFAAQGKFFAYILQ